MRGFWAVYKKELIVYFYSPIAYTEAAIFLIISGIFFFNAFAVFNMLSMQMMSYSQAEGSLNVTEIVLRPLFHNLSVVLLLFAPLLTMRLFSEEKKAGTVELLLTYPVTDLSVMLGKFFSCMTVYLGIFLPTIVGPILLFIFAEPEIGPVLTGYLGLVLMGGAFIAMGIFISALTENQVVAGVITFGLILMLWLVEWLSTFAGAGIGEFLKQLAFITHFENLAKGVLDTRDIIYYLVVTVIFLFLTLRSLESTRWRG